MSTIDVHVLKRLLPARQRNLATQSMVDYINKHIDNTGIGEQVRENFVSYMGLLSENKQGCTLKEYLQAVKYVSFRLLNYTTADAYTAVFPDRVSRIKDKGGDVHAFATMYNRNKLVNRIYEATMVPTYILNAPLYQEALNKLAGIIKDPGTKPLTAVKACEAILTHTKPPDVTRTEIKIDVENDAIAELREVTEKLAETYKLALQDGHKRLRDVAEETIVADYEEVEGYGT